MKINVISTEQARWARRMLGLSQRALSTESAKSLSYIKQFETGRFNPGEEFQRGLRNFFEGRGVNFDEFDEAAPAPSEPSKPGQAVKSRRPCFYAAQSLSDEELGEWLTIIDDGLDRLAPLIVTKVDRGFFGGQTPESEEITRKVFSELALIGYAYATIAGRFQLEPGVLTGDATTQEDLLADFVARAMGSEARAPDAEEQA